MVSASLIAFFYYTGARKENSSGCKKPKNGFLIIADTNGFNGSKLFGAPFRNWPIINVSLGKTFSITVCNDDIQAHGFQISYYLDTPINSIAPGQSETFTITANKAGNFTIYCSIFCTVHIYMQSGLLVVR